MTLTENQSEKRYREQHKLRMAHMPHLYFHAKPSISAWARPWQAAIQAALAAYEFASATTQWWALAPWSPATWLPMRSWAGSPARPIGDRRL